MLATLLTQRFRQIGDRSTETSAYSLAFPGDDAPRGERAGVPPSRLRLFYGKRNLATYLASVIAVYVPFGVMSILCTFKTSLVSGFSSCLVTT